MLGRCRMRRGVSLEVIVEEDDDAEVVLDPTPLMEDDDENQDDYDEDDSENGRSAPGSPEAPEGHGRGGGGGRSAGGSPGAEERRRRRERRRTIGGLSRMRSVSCEALTLLDTSDMDSCCSEWDDDDDLSTASSNYVTLNRPISRRRILESSQAQCDSEDSGIEYHSNEDDPVLEDQSSIEDRKEADESSDDMHDQETATESDDDTSDRLHDEAEEPPPLPAVHDTSPVTQADPTTSPISDANAAPSSDTDTSTEPCTQSNPDLLLSARTGKELFEERSKQGAKQEQTTTTTAAKYLQEYKANEVLENDKVVIVEKTPSVPARSTPTQATLDPAEEELQLKRAAYTIRNKEVQLEELPPPHTVRSVKRLFEHLNTPVDHFHAWCDLGRFRDIKSNPSSKILRFDRSDSSETAMARCLGVGSSLTLPRLPAHHKNKTAANTSQKSHNINSRSSTFPKESSKQIKLLQKSQEQGQVATPGGQPVALRKPTVHGFNVKKALLEDPRSFHAHSRTSDASTHRQQTTSNHSDNLHHKTSTNHHNRKSHAHLARQRLHHPSEAATDRSDTESLASDISEDSGLSNDSNNSLTSTVSSSTYRALDAYASDPSFKWIDPSVMAKIRSVGTTVIFFGPRQRPRGHDGTLHKPSRSTPSGLKVSSGLPVSAIIAAGRHFEASSTSRSTQQHVSKTGPVAAPRIVGVVRKRSPSTSSGGPTLTLTPDPAAAASDDSRASSPASRCSDDSSSGKTVRGRIDGDNTVVYDFTRPQSSTAWV